MLKKTLITLIIILILLVSVFLGLTLFSNEYTVRFDSSGGTKINAQIVEKQSKASKPIDPVKEGYEFDGWLLDGKPYYFDSAIKKSSTLKATWKKIENQEKYTISFDTNGGTKINPLEVKEGEKLVKPTNPTKEGYVFAGWLLNNNAFDFTGDIVSDIKLVASWISDDVETFTVTFDSVGGSKIENQLVVKDGLIKKPTNPKKVGYSFSGWLLNKKSFNFTTKVTSNINLTASWKQNSTGITSYTVSFNSDGGTSVGTQTITAGAKATRPANPTKSGYNFVNWTLNGAAYNFDNAVNTNIALVANWQIIQVADVYTVSLDLISGDSSSPERKAIIKKNGSVITVSQLLDGSGNILGAWNTTLGAVRVNKELYNNASSLKVKLTDNSIVNATKAS